jgi:predicted nucleic-acid-binding protein
MIGLDTNILVRYLAQDDPVQSPQATQIIEYYLTKSRPGFISLVTMVETVWVLDRIYGLSDSQLAAVVERMLQADTLSIQNEQEVFTAMTTLKTGKGSFADALIGALDAWGGCTSTLTFDQKAARLNSFHLAPL